MTRACRIQVGEWRKAPLRPLQGIAVVITVAMGSAEWEDGCQAIRSECIPPFLPR